MTLKHLAPTYDICPSMGLGFMARVRVRIVRLGLGLGSGLRFWVTVIQLRFWVRFRVKVLG